MSRVSHAHRADRVILRDGDVDTAVVAEYEVTRRATIRHGLLAGGSVLAAATVPALVSVRNAFAQAGDDASILKGAITVENTAVAAYAAAVASGRLDSRLRATAALFKRQEQEHADALSAALKGMGETPPTGTDARALAPLKTVRDQAAIVSFAIELEMMAIAAYFDAHKKLQDAKLLQTGAQIMASEGQHLVVLRQALKQNPVPNAFENGTDSS